MVPLNNLAFIRFKNKRAQNDFQEIPTELRAIIFWISSYAGYYLGQTFITITRIREPLSEGKFETGIHVLGRAIDFRDEYQSANGRIHCFSSAQKEELLQMTAVRFPRNDGKLTLLHHSVNNEPEHFHLQIPFSSLTKEEIRKETQYALQNNKPAKEITNG